MGSSRSYSSSSSSVGYNSPGVSVAALSKDALDRHNLTIKHDHAHTEGVIRAEGTRSYNQASADWLTPDVPNEGSKSANVPGSSFRIPNGISNQSITDQIGHIERSYRPSASNATPMERFVALSPSLDPYQPHAERALSDMGIDYGSLEHLETRSNAAKTLVVDSQPAQKRAVSDSVATRTTMVNRPWMNDSLAKRRADSSASGSRHEKRPRDR